VAEQAVKMLLGHPEGRKLLLQGSQNFSLVCENFLLIRKYLFKRALILLDGCRVLNDCLLIFKNRRLAAADILADMRDPYGPSLDVYRFTRGRA
jgi:hypothetical protein